MLSDRVGFMRLSLLSLGLLFVLLPALLAHQPAFAQEANRPASKFSEYGNVSYETVMAELDNYAIMLQAQTDTRSYIVVYRSRQDLPGTSHRYGLRERNYLVNDRGIDPGRIVIIDGGLSDSLRVELWIVPDGANLHAPLQSDQANRIELTSTVKYDEQYHPLPHDTRAFDMGEDDPARLDGYANLLRANPELRGYIIGYAQFCATTCGEDARGRPLILRDAPGTSRRMLEEKRQYLIRRHGIAPSRIVLIDGGYRHYRAIEMWLVPPGASAPRPSSNVLPRGRRQR